MHTDRDNDNLNERIMRFSNVVQGIVKVANFSRDRRSSSVKVEKRRVLKTGYMSLTIRRGYTASDTGESMKNSSVCISFIGGGQLTAGIGRVRCGDHKTISKTWHPKRFDQFSASGMRDLTSNQRTVCSGTQPS